MTDQREKAARAICAAQFTEVSPEYAWDAQFDDGKIEYYKEADAAIAAIESDIRRAFVGSIPEWVDVITLHYEGEGEAQCAFLSDADNGSARRIDGWGATKADAFFNALEKVRAMRGQGS